MTALRQELTFGRLDVRFPPNASQHAHAAQATVQRAREVCRVEAATWRSEQRARPCERTLALSACRDPGSGLRFRVADHCYGNP